MRLRISLVTSAVTLLLVSGCSAVSFSTAAGGDDAAADHASPNDSGKPDVATHKDSGGTTEDSGGGDARSDTSGPKDAAKSDTGDAGGVDGGHPGDATVPDGTATDGAATDAAKDVVTHEGGAKETGPACGQPTTLSGVYVDSAGGSSAGTGSLFCPKATVEDGVAVAASLASPAGGVTVYIDKGTTGTYTLPTTLEIPANVTLHADLISNVTLNGTGAASCTTTPALPCTLLVDYGASVFGVAVTSSKGNAIVTQAKPSPSSTAVAPTLQSVTASSNPLGSGIVALGDVVVGPNVSASGNAVDGLSSVGPGTVNVMASMTNSSVNHFNSNMLHGISVTGPAILTFGGGTASSNKGNGIYLGDTTVVGTAGMGTTVTHGITSITADSNGGSGIYVVGASSVHLSTTGATPSILGMNKLDGITMAGSGGLTFDGGTTSGNGRDGIFLSYLPQVMGSNAVPALLTHTITGLTAGLNTSYGVAGNLGSAVGPMTLTLRSSNLLTNVQGALAFDYGSMATIADKSTLDIGTTTDGDNVFGVPLGIVGAASAGLGLDLRNVPGAAAGLPAQIANGDTFSVCPPTGFQLTSVGAVVTNGYYDVGYFYSGGIETNPVSAEPDCKTTH